VVLTIGEALRGAVEQREAAASQAVLLTADLPQARVA